MLSKGSTKTRMVSEPVSMAGFPERQITGKSCVNPALVVRECGLMLYVDSIRVFAMGYHIFYESSESVSLPRCRGAGGEIRSLYTGILDFFLSKLHFGRNDRDIHDRGKIEFFHGKHPHFSLQPFILHKLLLFTLTSPKPGRQQTEAKAK